MSTDCQDEVIGDEEVAKRLAANISARMAEMDVSQNALSRKTGDAVMTINDIVNGRSVPRAGILARIAEALETTVDSLIHGGTKKSRRAS